MARQPLDGHRAWWPFPPIPTVLGLLIIFWIIILASFALIRHNRLNSSAYDLGIYSQVVWNTSRGDLFASSLEVNNFLGDHVAPVLLLLSPLYWLWPDAQMLLIVQAIALCLGAIPIYWISQQLIASRQRPTANDQPPAASSLPLLFALVYLLYPAIGFMNRFDFHTLVLATPLLLFAWSAWDRGRNRLATLFVLLALACNEEVGLTVFAWGMYLILVKKQRQLGITWAVLGVAWSLVAFFVIIPAFRGASNDVNLRYAWLGSDVGDIARTLLTRPGFVLQTQFGDMLRPQFLLKLLLPVGFLALLSPGILAIGLPCLGYNLLSSIPSQSSIYFHYIAPLIPFVFIAAAHGANYLQTRFSFSRAQWVLAAWLIGGTLLAWAWDNPFTQTVDDPYYGVYALERHPDQSAFAEARALIPPQASVATTMAYAPHLTTRPTLDLFYHKGVRGDQVFDFLPADYLFLHLTDLRWGVNPRLYYAMIETAIGRDGYQAVYFRDDVALLTREAEVRVETGAVLQRVIDLQEAGGKYAPTGQGTIDWVVSRWVGEGGGNAAANYFAAPIALHHHTIWPTTYLPGGPLCATLYWQADQPIPLDYTVFVHLRDATGYVQAQRDNVPVLAFYPTSQWSPGETIADMHCLQIPPAIPPGEYELVAGLYNPTTGERLPLTDQPADVVLLTHFTIPAHQQ